MGCSFSSPLSKNRLRHLKSTAGVSVGCGVGGGGGGRGRRDDVVSLCKERKRLAKKAVKDRRAFAHAHSKYVQSLSSVSAAIAVFVACYSSPPSPFFIAFESDETQARAQTRIPALEENEEEVCEHFYDEGEGECEWDYFNLLDEKRAKQGNGVERESEGVKKEEEQVNGNGRELLEALKDLEDHFVRAYESGMEVSRMLEVHTVSSSYPTFHDVKENASRKQSISSRSSSCKSFLSLSSRSTSSTKAESGGDRKSLLSCHSDTSSTATENKCDPLDGSCGMASGSHLNTLGRLYAWEKKLYHEVKAGQQIRKTFKLKYLRLQQKDVERVDLCTSKASSEVSDLYHLMLVSLKQAESISKKIEKLRDEELQPQLLELLHGLSRTWKSMSEIHEIQRKIMREINSFNCQEHKKLCNDSHRLATLQLKAVILDWLSCFSGYIYAQKAYVKSLHGWLSKFIDAEAEYHYSRSFSLPPFRFNEPTLLVTCQCWSASLERLPDNSVKYAMKSLGKDIQAMCVQQSVEQRLKRKVDVLDKEMDRKLLTVGKAEDKALMAKYLSNCNVEEQTEPLDEKEQLKMFRQKVEMETERYHSSVLETERVTMNRLRMGFSLVFESLTEFSRAAAKVYADLVTFPENAEVLKGNTCS